MIRATLVFTMVATTSMRVCGRSPSAAGGISTAAPMVPEHGGALAVSGGLTTEVAPLPDGRIVAYVRNAERAPVEANDVEVYVRKPDGTRAAVSVSYDPQLHGYVGRPAGLTAGTYPVEVQVQTTASAPTVQLVTPPVVVAASVVPAARYGGRVEVVGDNAVETVVARDGSVAMFWMDLEGHPIPTTDVQVPDVTVTVNGQPHQVRPRVEGDHFVASVPAPAATVTTVSLGAPVVVVRGRRYRHMVIGYTPVVAVMPRAVIVGRPAIAVAPTVVVAPQVVEPVFFGEVHGRGHGRAVFVGAAPGVVVAPGPGAVFVGGERHGHDDDHGRFEGRGHFEGHGHGHGHGH